MPEGNLGPTNYSPSSSPQGPPGKSTSLTQLCAPFPALNFLCPNFRVWEGAWVPCPCKAAECFEISCSMWFGSQHWEKCWQVWLTLGGLAELEVVGLQGIAGRWSEWLNPQHFGRVGLGKVTPSLRGCPLWCLGGQVGREIELPAKGKLLPSS